MFLIGTLLILNGLFVVLLVRNKRVLHYRLELLDQVRKYALMDAALGLPWEWRFSVFNSVTSGNMVHMFWKKMDSFYPDKQFIQPPIPNGPFLN